MVYWITGRKNSGKTTLAYRLKKQIPDSVVLDGGKVREVWSAGFSDEERFAHLSRITKMAKILENEGITVIIACISPRKAWREQFQKEFDECLEICLPFGHLWENTYYEEPEYEG